MNIQTKTLKVRVKDKHAKLLRRMAFDVNQVWNAVNAESDEFGWIPIPGAGWIKGGGISNFDFNKQFNGIRKERSMIISCATMQEAIRVHAQARSQFKKNKLRWRVSGGSRRSLGWVPFKGEGVRFVGGKVKMFGHFFSVWDSFDLSKYEFRAGSFSEDARGRWYFNVAIKYESKSQTGDGQIGIDLGLKTTATCSDGTTLERSQFYRNAEKALAVAQRANKKKRVKAIHAKVKNSRKDELHKFTTKLVKKNNLIVVGNVSSSNLAKTKMAKSVLDAGWYMLKTMLDYKSKAMQAVFIEVNESYTTQRCSSCQAIPDSSPKGRAGLGIREWECSTCGATHDRDVNASANILALGHERLVGGIPVL